MGGIALRTDNKLSGGMTGESADHDKKPMAGTNRTGSPYPAKDAAETVLRMQHGILLRTQYSRLPGVPRTARRTAGF